MRFKRIRTALVAVIAATALLAGAAITPSAASGPVPDKMTELRIQQNIAMAVASAKGVRNAPSRASIEASIRKATAAMYAKRRTLSLWGGNFYYPAMSWVNGGGTVTVGLDYYVESLSGGCRNIVQTQGFLNGGTWSLEYAIDVPRLYDTSQPPNIVREWNNTYTRTGDGSLGSPVASGLYTNSGTLTIYTEPADMRAKGASEGTWHYHFGNSHNAGLWCH